MTNLFSKEFLLGALDRVIRTIAQTTIALIGVSVTLQDVSWEVVASASLLAGFVSLLTSLALSNNVPIETTSTTTAKHMA